MSNIRSPSRSSPDLSGQPKDIATPRVSHPPRLQHSPSLPNIWFPQNSSPILREKEKSDQNSMHRPSAPSSPKNKPPASLAVKEPQMRHVKYASIDPAYRKPQSAKTHTRRRTERDEPHSLLTPPLTPSSSIRTTASSDSSSRVGVQAGREYSESLSEEILDPDTESTRILLFENVCPSITVASLESAIGDALTNATAGKNVAGETSPSSVPREVLKGINTRLHHDEGIVPVVFFDVREAKSARDLVNNKQFGAYLKKCIDDSEDDDQYTGLSARLITLEELFKIIGHSRFLDGIDGTFTLKVQKIHYQDSEDVRTPTEYDARLGSEDQEDSTKTKRVQGSPVTRSGLNIAILQNVLNSYGSVRFFKFIREEVDKYGVISIFYHVEYYDLRDADTSYQELNEQTTFGMKITLSGGNDDAENAPKHQGEPFPNSSTAGESFSGLPIRPAGTHSQMRQPFIYTVGEEDTAHEQPTVDLVSQTVSLPTNPSSGGGTSPTYFYTTTPFDPSNHGLQIARYDQAPVHVRGPGFPDSGRAPAMAVAPNTIVGQEPLWEQDAVYRSDCISPCYGHDGVCHYCPSRGVPHNVAYNPPFPAQYAFPPPPALTPPIYYSGPIPPPPMITNMVNIIPTSSPAVLGYEYTDPHMQPVPHSGAWGYDPAIAALGPGMNAPSPAPFFLREEAPAGRAGGRHPVVYTRSPSTPHVNQNHQRLQLEATQLNASQSIYSPRFSSPSSTPPSSHSAPLVSTESTAGALQPGGPTYDHNQLNLEKIITGMDTRTTVMIKNIPNKMSDSDLEAYIGKVCPHKIDFLYLRMDFKNGCNVGYAFVNFIHVEDLLHFAKERLGAKWNMFSSEKVLQMSYANYQGKEALVEKFKNSAIMDERESWRPRIFFSAGPNQGYPEPFPSPTHIRRKERSSYNRGTLFPPGVNSHTMASQSHNVVQNTTRRYHHDEAPPPPRAVSQRGVADRYQAHAHGRQSDDGGEYRRGDRVSASRTTPNQRATR